MTDATEVSETVPGAIDPRMLGQLNEAISETEAEAGDTVQFVSFKVDGSLSRTHNSSTV